jgi:hypothetical protein
MLRSASSWLAAAALALGALVLLSSPPVQARPKPKVPICHFDREAGEFTIIVIPEQAAAKHLQNHEGDTDVILLAFPDGDLDGFGAPGSEEQFACEVGAGTGFADNNTDCDDENAAVNPGAGETVGNGIDDDCDPATPDAPETPA